METGVKTKNLRIDGMACVNCQNKIEKKLRNTAGVQKADVSYSAGTAAITYDADVISVEELAAAIQKLGYQAVTVRQSRGTDASRAAGWLLAIAALYGLLERFGLLNLLAPSRLAEANMEYGMLFVIGLATSVHCVAMCGGINLSQCIPRAGTPGGESRFSALRPAFLYNLGRVISYTAVGFAVGGLGSAVTVSAAAQGILKLIAGAFMVVMGINMLGVFPWLRRLIPRMPKWIAQRVDHEKARSGSPLTVGLLNGFMPCGPLQAMQIYALSTGNAFEGALSMLLFSLGTAPLMFGLGALSAALGRRFTRKAMTVGAVLVAVLGLSMLSQGWSLSGLDMGRASASQNGSAVSGAVLKDGIQVVSSTLQPGRYPAITVQAGTPVKWMIDAPQGSINGCNNRIFIQEYGIEHSFEAGENVILFTPEETGTFGYSCWMGMIRGSITVTEPDAEIETPAEGGALQGPGLDSPPAPGSANVPVPANTLAVAERVSQDGAECQTVTIALTDGGFARRSGDADIPARVFRRRRRGFPLRLTGKGADRRKFRYGNPEEPSAPHPAGGGSSIGRLLMDGGRPKTRSAFNLTRTRAAYAKLQGGTGQYVYSG